MGRDLCEDFEDETQAFEDGLAMLRECDGAESPRLVDSETRVPGQGIRFAPWPHHPKSRIVQDRP